MFDVFGTIKALIKIESVRIDNNVFRLHYRFTVVLLVAFSIIVNSRQYFGDPIDCTSNAETGHVIDNFCWIHSYLTLPKEGSPFDQLYKEGLLPHPGIRGKSRTTTYNRRQHYYQWVGFVLFIQAAFFFLPRFIWKYYCEGQRVKALVTGLTSSFEMEEKDYSEKIRLVLKFIKQNSKNNTVYAFSFFFCEFLNLVNVICQILFTDWLLDYQFGSLGFNVISGANVVPGEYNDELYHNDFLDIVFPTVAKCDFTVAGQTKDLTVYRSICVLPVNTFNQKIYVVLWFWFISLTIISCIHILYTFILIVVPRVRSIQLQRHFCVVNENPWEDPSLASELEKKNEAEGSHMSDDEVIQTVCSGLAIGDWFLLYQLGKNMDALIFGKLLKEYALLLTRGRGGRRQEPLKTSAPVHRNSAFDAGKRGSFLGVGIGGSSAPLIK